MKLLTGRTQHTVLDEWLKNKVVSETYNISALHVFNTKTWAMMVDDVLIVQYWFPFNVDEQIPIQ